MKKIMITGAVLAWLASVSMASIISVNLCDWNGAAVAPRNPMLSSSLAGAPGVRTNNWNNLGAGLSSNVTGGALVYNTGAAVAAAFKIAYTSPRTAAQSANTLLNDALMFSGYNQIWNNQTNKVVLTDIPFTAYDLYIYCDSARANTGGRVSMVGQQDYYLHTVLATTAINTTNNTGAGYTQITGTDYATVKAAAGTKGNYVKYSNLSGTSQTFTLAALDMGDTATQRFQLNGFQIVEIIPEPATIGMLGLGALILLFRRRFKV